MENVRDSGQKSAGGTTIRVRDSESSRSRIRDNGQITRNAEGTGCFVRDREKFEIAERLTVITNNIYILCREPLIRCLFKVA